MLNILTDNLSRLEELYPYLPTAAQILIASFWFVIVKVARINYQISLGLSLCLLSFSLLLYLTNVASLAGVLGEYAFLFLMTGVIQMLIFKQSA